MDHLEKPQNDIIYMTTEQAETYRESENHRQTEYSNKNTITI